MTKRADDLSGDATDAVADAVDDTIDDQPWIESLTSVGWVAKGVVYFLMGLTAISIARQQPSDDDASPTGALNRVIEQPGGRVLLTVLGVGLVLYSLWRFLSVVVIRDDSLGAWLDRVGYTFSGLFYAVLAYTAFVAVVRGGEQGDDNTIERLSRTLLSSTIGRWLLAIGGVVTIGVGLYFVIEKGVRRSFVDDLARVDDRPDQGDGVSRVLVVSGVFGWIGRGVVTILVGFFVARAAYRFDPDDARGFDRAMRHVATSSTGTLLVWIAAVGLIAYGSFCLLSHRRRTLEDNS